MLMKMQEEINSFDRKKWQDIQRMKIHQKQQRKFKFKIQIYLAYCFMTTRDRLKERMKSKVNLLFPLARLIQLIICSQTSSS